MSTSLLVAGPAPAGDALGAVVFDFGGVLQRPAQTSRQALVAQHLQLDLELVKRTLRAEELALKRGEIDEAGFWHGYAAKYGGRLDDFASWANTLAAHYLAPGLNGEVLALAGKLAKLGLMTPLCSNTVPARAALNERRGAYAPFWPRLLSCEVGAVKPDARMFAALFAQTGLAPAQHLLVDDKPANVAAAEEAGMWGHTFGQVAGLRHTLLQHGIDL